MLTFIFLLFLSLFTNLFTLNAHNLVNNLVVFPSEKPNEILVSTKSIKPKKQKLDKETKKVIKQKNKEARKKIFKIIKETKKSVKEKSTKKKIKDSTRNIHWAAYLSFFGSLVAVGIIVAGLILKYALFNVLFPVAIGLLIVSFVASIIGISAVASKEMTLYHKSKTITLALIGGIISFLSLLFITLVIIALSNMVI